MYDIGISGFSVCYTIHDTLQTRRVCNKKLPQICKTLRVLQMQLRAWADSDPKSNAMKTYIVPEEMIDKIPQVLRERSRDYEVQRVLHWYRLGNEIIGLYEVCKTYNVLDDIFRLIRDRYVFRPVEKDATVKAKQVQQLRVQLPVCTYVLLCVCFIMGVVAFGLAIFAMPPLKNSNSHLIGYSWDCATNEIGVPTCMPISHDKLGPTGPAGVTGPPGICNVPILDGPAGPEGAKETRIKLPADGIKIKIQERS